MCTQKEPCYSYSEQRMSWGHLSPAYGLISPLATGMQHVRYQLYFTGTNMQVLIAEDAAVLGKIRANGGEKAESV